VTVEELIRSTEREIDAATRERSRYIAEVEVILGRASDDRRSNLTQAETRRVEELFQLRDAKREDIAKLKAKLATARQAATEEDDYQASMATRRPGASLPGRDEPRAGDLVRQSDGRRAALERGQRWADHPVVAEYAGRRAQVEDAMVGQHGSLAAHLRAMPPREVPSLQQERVMTTTTGSAVVPTVWATDIIDRARNLAAVTRAGAAIVPMDALIVQIGRLTADPTAAFRTEGSTVTASDPTFDNVTLTAKTMSALVVGSMEWFQDSPNVDEVVQEAIAKAIALQLDLVCLFGGVTTGVEQGAVGNNLLPTGGLPTPPNPRGILANLLANAASSVLGAATNGTVQTAATFYGEVIDSIFTPRDFNESPNALIWPSRLARKYAKAADSTNQPMRQPPDVDAITKFISNQIPSGMTQGTGTTMADLFVGDFNQLIIGQRLDLSVSVLTERYAELGQIAILAHWRGDVQLARPRAFSVYRFIQGV